MMYLKQSTSVDVPIGPFLDDTDGKTAETALTITQPDIRLKKNGGAWAQKAAAQTLTHEEAGWYEVTLDATDTDTVGHLVVAIHESGALPVWREFVVLEEAIYDAMFAASANAFQGAAGSTKVTGVVLTDTVTTYTGNTVQTGDAFARLGAPAGASVSADIAAIEAQTDDIGAAGAGLTAITGLLPAALVGGRMDASVGAVASGVINEAAYSTTAGAFAPLGIIDQGTAQSATATTLVLRAATPFSSDDANLGATLMVLGSDQGYWQSRAITDYTTADDTATVTAWDVTPSGTITYKIFGSAPSTAPTAVQIRQEMDSNSTQLSGIKTKTDFLPSATAGSAGGVFIAGSNAATTIAGLTTGALACTTITASGAVAFQSTFAVTTSTSLAALSCTTLTASGAVALQSTVTVTGATTLTGGLTAAITGNITGNLSGSVGSVTTVNDKTGYALSATGMNLVVPADPSAIPVLGTASVVTWIGWFGAWTVNEVNVTSSAAKLRNSADNADMASHTISDDGTTFSSSEPA
jgi:hypothetical protein